MIAAISKYLEYLQSVKNSSPHTVLNYRKDLEQFLAYLSPPGAGPPAETNRREIVRDPCGSLEPYAARNSSPTEGIQDISKSLQSFAATVPGYRPSYSIDKEKSAARTIT